ncbi:MAG: site-specific integrase [Deferrisomatales bacterium]
MTSTLSVTPPDPRERRVEPIRDLEAVRAVKALLAPRPRDLTLFTLGINNGLRAGDLLRVTVNQVRGVGPGQRAEVREKRTGGTAALLLPADAWAPLQDHLALLGPPPPPTDMYLFAGDRGWSPLGVDRLDELVCQWTRHAGLPGRYGADTLRKTFGYLQRTRYGVGLDVLARCLNQPSPAATARYLGLSDDPPSTPTLTEL